MFKSLFGAMHAVGDNIAAFPNVGKFFKKMSDTKLKGAQAVAALGLPLLPPKK